MTRLKFLRTHFAYPDDVKKICYAISEINSYKEAENLWERFSGTSAWANVDDQSLKTFHEWLMEDINET